MEQITLIIIGIVFASPYLVYAWLYGWILVLRMIKKEGPIDRVITYERLTPEQRMEMDRSNIEKAPKTKAKSSWVTSPTPRKQQQTREAPEFTEGQLPQGKWETQAEANKPNQRPT